MKLVFDRRQTANNTNKLGYLEIYIYDRETRDKIYISTGIELYLNQFEQGKGERGKIVKHPNVIAQNRELKEFWNEVEAFVLSDACNSLEDIKKWRSQDSDIYSFIEFLKREILKRTRELAEGTARQHNLVLKRLIEFGEIITFNDLTYSNINAFYAHLRELGMSETSLYKPHSILRSYVLEAMKQNKISSNPFDRITVKRSKSSSTVFLTQTEVEAIEALDFSKATDDKLEKVKDLFLFQCYTGLAYADMSNLRKEDISTQNITQGGKRLSVEIIGSNRQKTDERFIIPVLPQAKRVLEKYDYKLPTISNQKYNDYLKLIAVKANINKNITSHVARHTFAVYSLNEGIPIESVSAMMGHTNIKMTQHYAKLLGSTVISDVFTHIINKDNSDK